MANAQNGDGAVHYNFIVLGSSGQGRSFLLEELAAQSGTTVEELKARMAPSEAQLSAWQLREAERQVAEARRMTAVRQAYWDATSEDDSDIGCLHDAVVVSELCESPTHEQLRAVFMKLPDSVFGRGIAWGFSDTEVREDVYEFIDEHRQELAAIFKAP